MWKKKEDKKYWIRIRLRSFRDKPDDENFCIVRVTTDIKCFTF